MLEIESEKATEKYLNQEMIKAGGMSFKFTSPMLRGVPDRICIFPNGNVIFIEVKSEGDKPKAHQYRMHTKMRKHGAKVHVVSTKESVDKLLNWFINKEIKYVSY